MMRLQTYVKNNGGYTKSEVMALQNDNKIFNKNISYYTNSTIIPTDINYGLFNNLKHQESLQSIYSGGTVFHTYLGENITGEQAKELVKKITTNYRIYA